MGNLYKVLTDILGSETLWSAISAIFTGGAVYAIVLAYKQLRFDAWLKAQEVFTEEKFTEARERIFTRLDNPDKPWTEEEKLEAKQVCRKMDEFAHLAPFVSRKNLLEVWDDPIAKAWLILEPVVEEERKRTGWPTKWKAFQTLGQEAVRKLLREGRDIRRNI